MSTDQLRRQRGAVKAKLTAAENFTSRIADSSESVAKEEIESRIQSLDEAYRRCQAISQQLAAVVSEEEYNDRDSPEEIEIEGRYHTIRASLSQSLERLKLQAEAAASSSDRPVTDSTLKQVLEQQVILMQRLAERTNDTSGEVLARILDQQGQMLERISNHSGTPREPQVKLPMVKLPTFSGQIEEWKRYADTFKTLVHDSELSNVQKHQYLVGSLSGPAARVIESIEISDQNYQIAWKLLRERYEDERAIRHKHIQCIFEMPHLQRESAKAMRELVDHVQGHLRVLQAMKLPTEHWGELIVYLVERALDSATRKRWEEYAEAVETLTTEAMMEFLQRRCQILERASLSESAGNAVSKAWGSKSDKDGNKQKPFQLKSQCKTSLSTTMSERCCLCQGQHPIYFCNQFSNLSVEDRIQAVKRLRLCMNCLRGDHFVANCRAGSCRECGQRHNTLCHQIKDTASSRSSKQKPSIASAEASGSARNTATNTLRSASAGPAEASSGPSVHHVRDEASRKRILMSTAIVNAEGVNGSNNQLRVLLDSASETNFITSAACKRLGLNLDRICESVGGLGGMSCTIKHGCQLKLCSRMSNYQLNTYCLVVPKITKELPSFSIQMSQLTIPDNLKLADPLFYKPGNIDALLGGEFFYQLLDNGKIELDKHLPTLQNSKFGWIIAGPIPEEAVIDRATNHSISNSHTCLMIQDNVNDIISKFWELEEYYSENRVTMSTEEQHCENYFVNTMSRDSSGRFVVRLPFRENKDKLGESKQIAIKRFNYLERRFSKNREFHKQYSDFMHEYIQLKHMSKVVGNTGVNPPVYLPHHGVLRETSLTTKLRVVFDGSAKTASGISLNDTLMIGANLQDNIIDIILRFRLHAIAITADLQKMYRQIIVHEEDRDYQRVLWRASADKPIEEYQLNTVTYGLACAPFLAIRCVRELASDASGQFDSAAHVLLNDLYVDDILTGVDKIEDAVKLITQLKCVLNSGGFEPHKWRTNCKPIFNELIAIEQIEEPLSVAMETQNKNCIKTLGLYWHPERDIFEFSVQAMTSQNKTKREVLSAISKLYDPLGLISPILIRAKLIMQATWTAGLNWDEPLTGRLLQSWHEYANDLRDVDTILIPRRAISSNSAGRLYLHAFCDASLKAYGACVYLQTENRDGTFSSSLLCSKSRVAPIKNKAITLPRLELCGAITLVRLLSNVKRALKVEVCETHAWSDSTIVLAWIAGDPSRQKTFVANRVAEIQSGLPSVHWHHVKSEHNPADLVSRGTCIKNLQHCNLWWKGPDWLSGTKDRLRSEAQVTNLSQEDINTIKSEEKKESQVFLTTDNSNQFVLSLIDNYSSLSKLERVLTWIYRFFVNCKQTRENRKHDNISIDEIWRSRQALIKNVQQIHFASELSALRANKPLKSNSALLSLNPFISRDGLLRVGGRIQNSQATFDTRHPILLPGTSRLSRLIFEREHRRLLHAGPQALLYAIRERYWPLKRKVKWKTGKTNLTTNDIVLIQDNNTPPLKWKLGRVIETHTGSDDKVRVVTLKTASGICKRSINKLCKLPTNDAPINA